jgi:hypothetical protein
MHKLVELAAQIDDIVQFEQRDRKHRPILGTLGALGGVSAVQQATVGTFRHAAFEPTKPGASALEEMLNPTAAKWAPGDAKVKADLMATAKAAGVTSVDEHVHPAGPHFNPMSGGIVMTPNVRTSLKPGVLAHEVRHAQQAKLLGKNALMAASTIGKVGPLGAGLVSTFTGDEKRGRAAAITGAALAAPMLAAEADAAIGGARMLRKSGMRGLRTLSPGVGLATYGALAASPALAYKIKKTLGGYRKPAETPLGLG